MSNEILYQAFTVPANGAGATSLVVPLLARFAIITFDGGTATDLCGIQLYAEGSPLTSADTIEMRPTIGYPLSMFSFVSALKADRIDFTGATAAAPARAAQILWRTIS